MPWDLLVDMWSWDLSPSFHKGNMRNYTSGIVLSPEENEVALADLLLMKSRRLLQTNRMELRSCRPVPGVGQASLL